MPIPNWLVITHYRHFERSEKSPLAKTRFLAAQTAARNDITEFWVITRNWVLTNIKKSSIVCLLVDGRRYTKFMYSSAGVMLYDGNEFLQQQTLANLAADRLSRAITFGELKPGERLVERELSERFGISRAPIREALFALERQGLIYSIVRRGTFVRTWTKQDLWEVASLRSTLFALAGQLAAPCISDDDLTYLQGLVDEMQTAANRDDDRRLIDLDFYFEQRVLKCCPHKRLQQSLLDMRLQFRVFRTATVEPAHAIYPAAYRAIMNAFRQRDPELVQRTIHDELTKVAEAALIPLPDEGAVQITLPTARMLPDDRTRLIPTTDIGEFLFSHRNT